MSSRPSPSSPLEQEIEEMGRRARQAALRLPLCSTDSKNAALLALAEAIEAEQTAILAANEIDLAEGQSKGLSAAMMDRLALDPQRLRKIAQDVRDIAQLPDPVGETLEEFTGADGIEIRKVRVPIGVVGILYESRPNVTCDAAALCLKSGNATILRGGKEAIHSNRALAAALQRGLEGTEMPTDAIQLVSHTDRESVRHLCQLSEFLDVLIPRGGQGLIRAVTSMATMPVLKHFDGICHMYLDASADPQMAVDLVDNAKTQRPGVCNALETLLVDQAVAHSFLPKIAERLWEKGVELRGDAATREILGSKIIPATEEDWRTEYLALILSIRVVDGLDMAVEHINRYGSRHSDAIVSTDPKRAALFQTAVDSSAVFWNTSTRYNDGGCFGFGAEIGISTDKLHARGPCGLKELTSYKYLVKSEGQTRH
ncbi:MAG: glutamate-5-semialdehyde dehydrogenase [Verrucomicrobiota bacterium]